MNLSALFRIWERSEVSFYEYSVNWFPSTVTEKSTTVYIGF